MTYRHSRKPIKLYVAPILPALTDVAILSIRKVRITLEAYVLLLLRLSCGDIEKHN